MLQAIYTSSKVKFHWPIKISVTGIQNKIIHLHRIYFRLSNVTGLELFPRRISSKHFIAFLYNVLFFYLFHYFLLLGYQTCGDNFTKSLKLNSGIRSFFTRKLSGRFLIASANCHIDRPIVKCFLFH